MFECVNIYNHWAEKVPFLVPFQWLLGFYTKIDSNAETMCIEIGEKSGSIAKLPIYRSSPYIVGLARCGQDRPRIMGGNEKAEPAMGGHSVTKRAGKLVVAEGFVSREGRLYPQTLY